MGTMKDLEPLTIVMTGDHYGVVLARDGVEYRVRIVASEDDGYGGQAWYAYGTGLFNREQITQAGFCENDYMPGLILAAAANVSHCYGARYVRVL